MTEQTPLATTLDGFDRARGDGSDSAWAFAVSWNLLMRDVDASQVRDALEEALALVRETGEPPAELFGTPGEHADALYGRWVSEGRLVLVDAGHQSWPASARLGLTLSAVYAVLLGVVTWAGGDLDAPASVVRVVLISLVIGFGTSLGLATWSRRHRRPSPPSHAPADLRWSMELTEILRSRYAMSSRRVRDIVAEANAHAIETGSPVEVEFGTPTSYAARFAPDLRRRSRLTVAFLAALAVSVAVLMTDGVSWAEAGLLAGFAWLGWREHRTSRRLGD